MTIVNDLAIDDLVLLAGSHQANAEKQMCVMEAVAYVAGEPWSDGPQCACPVLTSFMVAWNDSLNDIDRQRLKPYIPRLIGTRSTAEVESIRSWMACDWLVRTFAPAWLRLAGLTDDATALEGLPALTSTRLANAALPTINKAQALASATWDAASATWDAAGDAAGDAARDATWDAARDATWDAARAAAGDAAGDAARAAAGDAARGTAGDAARDAAGDAAGDAARAAARDAARVTAGVTAGAAARAALAPTVSALQDSAFDLLDRMLAVTA